MTKSANFNDLLAVIEGRVDVPEELDEDERILVEKPARKPRGKMLPRNTFDGTEKAPIRFEKYDPEAEIAACDPEVLRKKLMQKTDYNGYTLSEIKDIWRRSRKDEESIEIISDLTCLYATQVMILLGLNKSDVQKSADLGIANYWATR